MALTDIIPSHFPELYQSEFQIEHQQMVDHVRQFMPVYPVQGEVRKFHRLKKTIAQKVKERPTAGAPEVIASGDTTFGDTEIVNLYTEFYEAQPAQVDKREAIRLGSINSPHDSLVKNQYAALGRQMAIVATDGILGDRKVGKTGGTSEAMPAGNIITGASGMDYDLLDEVYTKLGANQVLGQNVEGNNTWAVFCRHKDLRVLRNDATLSNRDFSDIRPIDKGTIYEFRGGYIVVMADEIFANQLVDSDANVKLPMFARDCVAFGDTETPTASADVLPEWRNNVLLQLEAGFGATTIDPDGAFALKVPV